MLATFETMVSNCALIPVRTVNIVRLSCVKSLVDPSVKDTVTVRVADVGTENGADAAPSPGCAIRLDDELITTPVASGSATVTFKNKRIELKRFVFQTIWIV